MDDKITNRNYLSGLKKWDEPEIAELPLNRGQELQEAHTQKQTFFDEKKSFEENSRGC